MTAFEIENTSGFITNIQRFSVHDGPGIRTTVFFKGCSLRCYWCHNPEGIEPGQEIQYFNNNCIGCGACAVACAYGAHRMENNTHLIENGTHTFDRSACIACGDCVVACYPEALKAAGRYVKADEAMREILRDSVFFENHDGGVTFSGGEPFFQPEFLRAMLLLCGKSNITTAVETSLHAPWDVIEPAVPYIDHFMVDIKHPDGKIHKDATGADNTLILSNLARLAKTGADILIRVPVIPGFNDSATCMEHIESIMQELGLSRIELLPFHDMAKAKYQSLGR